MPVQIIDNGGDFDVVIQGDSSDVDVSDVHTPSELEDAYEESDHEEGFESDVSDNDHSSGGSGSSVFLFDDPLNAYISDPETDDSLNVAALNDFVTFSNATYSFTPQDWQLSVCRNRALGSHYIITRSVPVTGQPTYYYVVVGRGIQRIGDTYSYSDCDFYTFGGSGSSYRYDFSPHSSGTFSGSSVIVYSDLYFDYFGGRHLSYDTFWILFAVPLLTWFFTRFLFKRGVPG